jgi:tRNA threonylcarbamoyladenosine biosynthesis protein TsaB
MDTTGRHLQLAWEIDGKAGYFREEAALTHSQTLLPRIDGVLGKRRTAALDWLGVVTGPGSFTGIRIGLATAKGFAYADTRLKLVQACALRVRALNADIAAYDSVVSVADGGNRVAYVAVYDKNGEVLAPAVMTYEQLDVFLQSISEPVAVTGDVAALQCPAGMKKLIFEDDGRGLALAMREGMGGEPVGYAALAPVYIQVPQALK